MWDQIIWLFISSSPLKEAERGESTNSSRPTFNDPSASRIFWWPCRKMKTTTRPRKHWSESVRANDLLESARGCWRRSSDYWSATPLGIIPHRPSLHLVSSFLLWLFFAYFSVAAAAAHAYCIINNVFHNRINICFSLFSHCSPTVVGHCITVYSRSFFIINFAPIVDAYKKQNPIQ